MRDVYEMMTYLLVVIISCIVMAVWLKRKAKKKKS
ncbi:PEP-CTERM protein-sorting domain-containing protein [Paenibacillus tarimensis]